jgi:hypothetical protein
MTPLSHHGAFVSRDCGRLHLRPPLLAEDVARSDFLKPPISLFSESGQRSRNFVKRFHGVDASCENVVSQLALGQRPGHPSERY